MVEQHQNEERPDEVDEDEIDDELIDLVSSNRQGSLLRPILFLVVIWFGASIIGDWQSQLSYFFSSSDPVELGSVTEFAAERARDPDWRPNIPHNRYVSVEGVPSKRARSERYDFFKLVGGQVYVEVPREESDQSALEREFGEEEPGDVDRTYFEGAGRAMDLSKVPERYHGLRNYYYENYGTYFCGMELPERQQRAAEAAGEECVEAYLVETDVEPLDHWWYALLTALIGVFILLNIWWLYRWIRDFISR